MVTGVVTIFLSFLYNIDYLQLDCRGVTGAQRKYLSCMKISIELLRGDGGQGLDARERALNCLDQVFCIH